MPPQNDEQLLLFLIFIETSKVTATDVAVTIKTTYPIGNEEEEAGEKAKYSPKGS